MDSTEKFCRFCLKEMVGTAFENIEETVRNMSNILNLKMNLDISEKSVICVDCLDNLQRLYSFKVTCIETKNRLLPFMNFHIYTQIDLTQVYIKINGNKSLGDKNICRFCMTEIPSDMSIELDTVINAMPSIKELLIGFLPEVDLTLVRDPIICKKCHSFLQDYLSFTKNCENVEQVIKKHIEAEGANPETPVALKNVQQFLNGEIVVKQEIDHIDICKHETQQSDSEFMEDLLSLDLKSENYFRTEGFELDIKREDMDLKPVLSDAERALTSTSLMIENIKKQEGDEFDETKVAEQFCESLVSYNCNESNFKVKAGEDNNKDLCISENHKYRKHKIKRKCYSRRDLPYGNSALETKHESSSKNARFADKTALDDLAIYKCDNEDCLYETKYKSYLAKHRLIHKDLSEVKIHKCGSENCLYVTKYKSNLSKHKLIHKDLSEVTMYKCAYDGCSFETKRKNNVSVHELVHKNLSEVTIYKCENEDCSFETRHKRNLNVHRLLHKDISEVTIYKCNNENCSYETRRKKNLINHRLIHKDSSEVIMYKCEYGGCSFETKRKDTMSKHKLVHKDLSEVTVYKCENEGCSFETKRKDSLKSHRLVHKDFSEVAVYKCKSENCLFETKHKRNLISHKLIHQDLSEVTIYKCEDCSYITKYKCSLVKHRKTHTGS